MHEVLFGTSLLTAFAGGLVALLAPCCVSVMLPAYLATGFRRRTGVLAGTLVFAAGVATVIVPIGLGASALTVLISGHHLVVFLAGGVAMAVGGVAVIAGWKPRLPMPASRSGAPGEGVAATYELGVFSGAASACCAPVLAGVAVLSGASGSFRAAVTLSFAYVAGMVIPLALLALVWDRRDWASSRWLHGRDISFGVGAHRRSAPIGAMLGGAVLVAMGLLTAGTAFTGSGMGSTGWRERMSADLGHWSSVMTRNLTWLPGWGVLVGLLAMIVLVVRQVRSRPHHVPADRPVQPSVPTSPSEPSENPGHREHTDGTPTRSMIDG